MTPPVASAGMLIRRPVAEVFEAFVDPAITTRFWFTHGSGRLEPGATVRWTWAMYGASAEVLVRTVEPGRRIAVDWGDPGAMTQAEWTFEDRGGHAWIEVTDQGFHGDDNAQAARAIDSAGGFALVLAGAKIWLEHGIDPRFIVDRHPSALVEGWESGR